MTSPQTGLVRAIGRWSLAALAVNSIIGSGIFGLPATVAGLLGQRSVVAVLIAGAAMGVIMACFAEVASQFSEAGGPYLYALDSTTIDLCLSLFPWAKFRKHKAAVKMHTLLDLHGNIP